MRSIRALFGGGNVTWHASGNARARKRRERILGGESRGLARSGPERRPRHRPSHGPPMRCTHILRTGIAEDHALDAGPRAEVVAQSLPRPGSGRCAPWRLRGFARYETE